MRISPTLTPREKSVIEASIFPRIKELKQDQLRIPLVEAIAQALFIKQNKDVGPDDQKEMADYVAKTLKDCFTTYRVPEVLQAIEMGARGELFSEQDMNVVSPENIFKWIQRFNEKIRREAIHKQKIHDDKLALIKEETDHQAKIRDFESVIKGHFLGFPESLKNENYGSLAAYYRHLDKKGLVKLSLEVKKKIFAEAENIKETDKTLAEQLHEGIKIEYTSKEIAEAMALKEVFQEWKDFEFELNF